MVPTGRTLVQIISEPTKPIALLTTLHVLQEHTEGPTNQPWFEVYEQVVELVNGALEQFETDLTAVMVPFER